jgi:hypothetical protein
MMGENKGTDSKKEERKVRWVQERPNVWRIIYAD